MWSSALPAWLNWLRYLFWPLFAVAGVLIIFYTFSLITNLIAAPFNGMLAEAVEKHLTGQAIETGGWQAFAKDFIPSILSELRKLLYFLLRALPLGILFLIPGIIIAAPFIWGLFSAWMLAIEYIDYPMANHLLHFSTQRKLLRQRRLLSYGFGGDGCGPEGIQFLTVTHTHFPDMMNEKKSLSWHLQIMTSPLTDSAIFMM